jgi:O-antigen ligase
MPPSPQAAGLPRRGAFPSSASVARRSSAVPTATSVRGNDESFEEMLIRNLGRAPLLIGVGLAFVAIRAIGARAGAVLLALSSAVLVPISVVRPEIGAYALIFNNVNELDSYYDLRSYTYFSVPILLDVAISVGIYWTVVAPRRLPRLAYSQTMMLLVYVVLVCLSILFSPVAWPNDLFATFRTSFLIRPILFFFLIVLVRTPDRLQRLVLTWFIAHALLMTFALSDFLQKNLVAYRVAGTVKETNYLSYICMTTLPILLAVGTYFRSQVPRIGVLGLGVVTLFISLHTLSRGGYLALAVTGGFFVIRFSRNPQMMLSALLFLALFYLMMPAELSERFAEVQSLAETDRYKIGRVALRMALDNPFFGVGWFAFASSFMRYDYEHEFTHPQQPHSIYLSIAGSTGFPALFAYLAVYFLTFVQVERVVQKYRRARDLQSFGYFLALGVEGALIGHFTFGMTGAYGDSNYAYLLLALAIILVRHHEDPKAERLR